MITEQTASLLAARGLSGRHITAYDMRCSGIVYSKIGKALGVSLERARQLVKRAEQELATAEGILGGRVSSVGDSVQQRKG